jgi:uncharacterized protein YacL
MIFVEGVRLIVVLVGALMGYEIGDRVHGGTSTTAVVGLLIGAAVSYVIGGVSGRILDKGLQRGVRLFRHSPPGEIFAATIISTSGMILGLMVGMAAVAITRSAYALVFAAGLVWILAAFGWRLGMLKGRQIVAAAGLSRILSPATRPLPGQALLVDASAVMDRSLLILGRNGLLPAGLVIPQFVTDYVSLMAESPDPVSSRRARRGLEGLEAMRELGVSVDIAHDEVPEVDDPTTKLLTVARRTGLRIGTCSTVVRDNAETWDLAVVNLHALTTELSPDYVPGERMAVSLVKQGRQPRQAVGYLPDGDMVVVNDASHLVDEGPVLITVLSTRPTSQGVMVFAKLASPTEADEASTLEHQPQ